MSSETETKEYCCEQMGKQLPFDCPEHEDAFDCPDALIYYSEFHRKYGLIIHDGGSSYVEIEFCPWCAAKLT